MARVRALIRAERPHLAEGLAALGCESDPGEANFLLFRAPVPLLEPCANRAYCCVAAQISADLARNGTVLRYGGRRKTSAAGGNKNRSGGDEDMRAACKVCYGARHHVLGQSLLCAALCRIFAQDGWRVAPFKSKTWL